MTTLSLSLPEDTQAFIDAQAAEEGYPTTAEYLLALIRAAQKREAKREREANRVLEAKFLEGLEGPLVEMTSEDWDGLEREAMGRLSGESIRS